MAKGLRMLPMLLLFLPLLSAAPLDTTGGYMRTNNEKHNHEDMDYKGRLRQMFKSIDANDDGIMDATEFVEFSRENNIHITETEAEKVLTLTNGTVGFTEDYFVEVLKYSPSIIITDLIYFLMPAASSGGAHRLSRVSFSNNFETRLNTVFLALDVDHTCSLLDTDLLNFFKEIGKEISVDNAKKLLNIESDQSGGVNYATWKNLVLNHMFSTDPLVTYWTDSFAEVENTINSGDGVMRVEDTIIKNSASIVVTTLELDARMDECYTVELVKVESASVKLAENGLEYTLKLMLDINSGTNCQDKATKICGNFVVWKPLPQDCRGISSLKIIKRDQVTCTNICAVDRVATYECFCQDGQNGKTTETCATNQICSSTGTCLEVCDPSPEGDCFCLGANHQGELCTKGKICNNGVCLDLTGLHFPDNKCFPENLEMVFYISANRFPQIDMPKWEIALKGTGVSQAKSSRPSLGITTVGDPSKPTSFKGKVYSLNGKDGDVIGMIFGFQDPANFFVVASSRDDPGPMNWYVGRVHGTCGTSCATTSTISDAIWDPTSHPDEITVLEAGSEHWLSWKHYKFSICFNPSLLEVDVTVINESDKSTLILETGVISAATGKTAVDEKSRDGGLIGMYVDSQKDVHWEGLECGTCVFPAVHGEYSQWSEYGSCSVTCGDGVKTRTRTCTEAKYGGQTCEEQGLGSDTETTDCNNEDCENPDRVVYLLAAGTPGNIEIYDPSDANLHCSIAPELETRYSSHSTFYHDNSIYLCGGAYSNEQTCISHSSGTGWKTHTLTTSREYGHTTVVLHDRVYFIGGAPRPYPAAESTPLPLTETPVLTPVPNLDYRGLYQCTARIDEDTLVITGGDHNGNGITSTVSTYNVKTGAFTQLPSLKEPRYRHGCGVWEEGNNKWIIVAGGYKAHIRALQTTEMLQLGGSEWISMGNLNVGRYDTSIAVTKRGVMVMGGRDASGSALNKVELLDWSTSPKTWSLVEPSLDNERSEYGGVVEIPASLYDCTVEVSSGRVVYFLAGGTTRDIEIYDPRDANLHCSITPPTRLENDWKSHGTFYHDNTIYLCGGEYGKEHTCTSHSPGTGWKTYTITPSRQYGHNTVVLHDRVYIIGGYGSPYPAAESTPLPLTDTPVLTPVPNLDYKGEFQCTAKIDEDSFVITGGYNNGYLDTVSTYNVKTGAFTQLPSLKQARIRHGCGVWEEGNKKWIIVAGGHDYQAEVIQTTEMLQLGGSEWISMGNLNLAKYDHSIAVTQRGVMVIGGKDASGNYLNKVELLDWSTSPKTWSRVEPSLYNPRSSYGGAVEIPASMYDCRA